MKNFVCAAASLTAALTTAVAPAALAKLRCYRPPRFSVSTTEVVDAKTGLTWQRATPSPKTWAVAATYCRTLGEGFRLPSDKELLTIVDYTKRGPAIDLEVFPGTQAAVFWTSTPWVQDRSFAWILSFDEGGTGILKGGEAEVRCVR